MSMRFIVNRYTREAGVRSLERQLATVCRKAALRIVQKPNARIRLTEKNVEQYLGVPRFSPDKALEYGQIGVATGLAWTSNGGALLPVEVVTMPGKGHLMVTGQLGDVMQESARAGLSYIRSRAQELHLPEGFPEDLDIHIHLPEGAIPKDGPSAGITMALAIISALTRQPSAQRPRHDWRDYLAWSRAGHRRPQREDARGASCRHPEPLRARRERQKDLAEIPAKMRNEMHFTLVESMDEVIAEALLPPEASAKIDGEHTPSDATDRVPAPPAPIVVSVEEHDVVPPTVEPGEQPTA